MNLLLILASLFCFGSLAGWVLEVFYRRFFSSVNPERKWINPGFCTGPYLPLYGSGLCVLYLLASLEKASVISDPFWNKTVLFLCMAAAMTLIEYGTGLYCLKVAHVRLWDYRSEWGNIGGIICPKFSLYWALIGAAYYFLIHPRILRGLEWLSQNLAFSFFIGMFFGIFLIDAVQSAQLVAKLRKFAVENEVIVRYEAIKLHIRAVNEKNREKLHFFFAFRSERSLLEHLREMRPTLELHVKKKK